jgi:tetratricopeptide (TPR) repeat protein
MSEQHPTTATSPASPSPLTRRHRRWFAAVFLLAGAGVTAAVWWFNRTPTPPLEVPLPADIEDDEIRHALESARGRVLAQPESADEWGFYGMTLAANFFDQEASVCFSRAERLAPEDARWPYLRGRIALQRNSEEALPLLRRAAAAKEATAELHAAIRLRLAEALLERREIAEAEAIFQEEWERRPDDARAALGLGMLRASKDTPQDRRAAEELLKVAYGSPSAHKAAAVQLSALARVRNDHKAAADYAKVADLAPADQFWPDPLREQVEGLQAGWRGRERDVAALERQRRFAEAAQIYLDRIEAGDQTEKAYLSAGVNLVRLRDYERGLELLRHALELYPQSPQLHGTLGLSLLARSERELGSGAGLAHVEPWLREALSHAQQATRLRPDFARAYMVLGLAFKHLGNPTEAVAPLRRGVGIAPSDFELQLALSEALVQVAAKERDPELRQKQMAEAREHLGNARLIDPNDPRLKAALERLAKAGD